MKDFFNKLTLDLNSIKENEFVCKDSRMNWIFKNVWNLNVILFHQDIELIKFGRHLSLIFEKNYFILREYGKDIIRSEKMIFDEQQKINISFSFPEGIMRIIGTGLTDGTWKGSTPRTKSVTSITFSNDKTKPYVDFIGEQGRFFQISDSLKNISGLKLWVKSDNPCELHPDTKKIKIWKDNSGNSNDLIQPNSELAPVLDTNTGEILFVPGTILEIPDFNINFHKNTDLTIFVMLEMSEYVLKEKKQKILSISNSLDESIDMILEKKEEQIGRYPEFHDVTKIYLNHIFTSNEKTFINENFVDLFTSYKFLDKYIRNQKPGPQLFLLAYQSIKNNKVFIKDYNYNENKWFSLTETNEEFEFKINKENKSRLLLSPDKKFSGKIKEIFIFDRMFLDSNEQNNENWIFLYLKQKYKLNNVKFTLEKK